ncbi:MAG TPA: type II toxin-antitoxin system YafQ family toxin [Thermomicrobiales bacterium]|nr:type II toxin-antitoxin system YafQ family toxin [Thermomicrobiales bacterium]
MYKPRATKQFRKDLRRYTDDFERLLNTTGVMHSLLAGETLPPEFTPHKLKGEYKDTWECHIESDLLLIWLPDPSTRTLTYVRLGTHSELFG